MTEYTIDLSLYPDCRPLIEQATTLIKSGKRLHIQTAGVPFSVRSKLPFKNYQMKIYQLFRDPSYVVGTCLHEAAHAVVMEEDGILNTRFFGPAIQYNRTNKTLFPSGARIEPGEEPDRILNEALIFERTTQLVVGGIAL